MTGTIKQFAWVGAQLRSKRWSYWAAALLLGTLGVFVGRWIGDKGIWIETRYRLTQVLTQGPFGFKPQNTVVVLINDEEYYKGSLAGRRPIKRDYLADLVRALDNANAAVIALDFDLRAPDPEKLWVPEDYSKETHELLAAIKQVTRNKRHVVLPKTIGYGKTGGYVLEPDIYDGTLSCPSPRDAAEIGRAPGATDDQSYIHCGYIALPTDMREIPPALPLEGRGVINSFSLAIAEARNHLSATPQEPGTLGFTAYIPLADFYKGKRVFPAANVLTKAETQSMIAHKTVLVGGAWSLFAAGRGPKVDGYLTPSGRIPGVFVHANYAEALLQGKVYRPIPEGVIVLIEGFLVTLVVFVLAAELQQRRKVLIVAVLGVSLLLINYVMFQNLGRFFDSFIPLVFVGAHAIGHRVFEWRTLAHRYLLDHARDQSQTRKQGG